MKHNSIKNIVDEAIEKQNVKLTNVYDGTIPIILANVIEQCNTKQNEIKDVVFLANDSARISELEATLPFFAPSADVIHLAAWDCLPYDRISPSTPALAKRIFALCELAGNTTPKKPRIFMITPASIMQRVPPRKIMKEQFKKFNAGQSVERKKLIEWLALQGFENVANVHDAGEYAVRGSIIDIFAAGYKNPIRLDFFGQILESIRTFDVNTQRTKKQLKNITLIPMSEVPLDKKSISMFRTQYLKTFGAAENDDRIYHSVSEGKRYAGIEHYLPLFFNTMETIFNYCKEQIIVVDHLALPAMDSHNEQVKEHYNARLQDNETHRENHKALKWDKLYLSIDEIQKYLNSRTMIHLSPFNDGNNENNIALNFKPPHNFAADRHSQSELFPQVAKHINKTQKNNKKIIIACWSEGSKERLTQIMKEHEIKNIQTITKWSEMDNVKISQVAMAIIRMESGFETNQYTIISEQDILGDRLTKKRVKNRSHNVLVDVSNLAIGDFVVHVDHGIARFNGLVCVEANGVFHDCLDLRYFGDDKLFLPVENIDLLSRFGSENIQVNLDKLGTAQWQIRKAKAKKHILEMANELINIAATRATKYVEPIEFEKTIYDEFAARFPYAETQDQLQAINDVMEDLKQNKPMDRLICGDVGFGKTEVALRATFATAMDGKQIAIIVPTTLLARQHYATFKQRFNDFGINIAQASRLVKANELAKVKENIKNGKIDVVIGTHALLGDSIKFKNLGLMIIDEEQHFGVRHKEKLKKMKDDVHVLTLSATPIPRTLHLSLVGVRDLSLITTAPLDRMAVRTFIAPFDKITIRNALLRERHRGGRSFYVCPRISDLSNIADFLKENVPELKFAIAHAKMPPTELEDIMVNFYEGKYDILLCTTIVESGLDIAGANTLIVHRADRFGLSQLYQLRGRVGRSKVRAYAFMTVPEKYTISDVAHKRLKVLQSLDTLGSGFQLASQDLEIRGAGNLLGEKQSGHVKEVGYELYQQMLEDAISELKDDKNTTQDNQWSPALGLGITVMIPEKYVQDLSVRLNLYRRMTGIENKEDGDAFIAELIDRFGKPLPKEIYDLIRIVLIKAQCKKANIEKIDAGEKGFSVQFRNNTFKNVEGLLKWIGEHKHNAQIRQDESIVIQMNLKDNNTRLNKVENVVKELYNLCQ